MTLLAHLDFCNTSAPHSTSSHWSYRSMRMFAISSSFLMFMLLVHTSAFVFYVTRACASVHSHAVEGYPLFVFSFKQDSAWVWLMECRCNGVEWQCDGELSSEWYAHERCLFSSFFFVVSRVFRLSYCSLRASWLRALAYGSAASACDSAHVPMRVCADVRRCYFEG
jgi:hypothetical protein